MNYRLFFLLASGFVLLLLTRCATPQQLASACKYKTEFIDGDSCLVSAVPVEDDFYSGSYYLPCFEAVNVPTACIAANYRSGQPAIRMHIREWQMEGKMTVYYPDGKLKEERNYSNDDYGREYIVWYENGQVQREVIPVEGTRLSKYRTWTKEGELSREGFYIFSDSLSQPLYDSIVSSWSAGKQMVKDGNGIIASYYSNGQKSSEMLIVNGKAEGVARVWDSTGVLIEELRYENGKLHGPYVKADNQGRVVQRGFYINGLKDSTWIDYYLTGRVKSLKSYKCGSECGLFREWHENGLTALEYRAAPGGKIEGEERAWHANGQLKYAGTYVNGYRHGTFAWWKADGTRDFEQRYEEGREVSVTCYRNGKRLKKCPKSRFFR